MLVNLNDVLVPARKGKHAVGLFSMVNPELVGGVMEAAGELGSPAIIGIAEVPLPCGPIGNLANLLISMMERASVPAAVRLDHGLKEKTCRQALDLGFSSIIYDCFTMEYEVNIEHVKKMAEAAHACGASIEAELGHVGDNGGEDPSLFYTDSVQTRGFIERTGAGALAIAVGMAHGVYKLPPKLDFNRIAETAESIPTPPVLHEDSGLPDSDFRTVVERGISKVDIFTDINQVCARAAALGHREGVGFTDIVLPEIETVKQSVMEKMRPSGSVGRGSERQGYETEVGCT